MSGNQLSFSVASILGEKTDRGVLQTSTRHSMIIHSLESAGNRTPTRRFFVPGSEETPPSSPASESPASSPSTPQLLEGRCDCIHLVLH